MVKKPRNDGQLRRVEQLLCEDAENYLKELDDPQQQRRRFERIVDRLEREGFAEPSAPKEEGAPPPPPPCQTLSHQRELALYDRQLRVCVDPTAPWAATAGRSGFVFPRVSRSLVPTRPLWRHCRTACLPALPFCGPGI